MDYIERVLTDFRILASLVPAPLTDPARQNIVKTADPAPFCMEGRRQGSPSMTAIGRDGIWICGKAHLPV